MLAEVEALIIQGIKELFKREFNTPQLRIIHEIYKDIRVAIGRRSDKEYVMLDQPQPQV